MLCRKSTWGTVHISVLLFSFLRFCNGNPVIETRGFQVFRIVPENADHLKTLKYLSINAESYDVDFWKSPTKVGVFSDVMIPSNMVMNISKFLANSNIPYDVTISDVAKMMKEREISVNENFETADELGSFFRRFYDDGATNKAKYNFRGYGTYAQITSWLRNIQTFYPSFTKVFHMGTTNEGRSIDGIKIGNHISDTKKRIVFIDGGMHAREWASIHTALFFINELVSKYNVDTEITHYINSINFYIVPCMNPDGYEYSLSSSLDPKKRFWRKNRSEPICNSRLPTIPSPVRKCCHGVDLNRNFDFHWSETGSNSNPCADNYQGPRAFSEPETRALRDTLLSPELRDKTDAYISMHTYSQLWIYPWGHLSTAYPDDVTDLKRVAQEAVLALKKSYGTKYKTGTGADLLYEASGASIDWAKKYANVKYSYVLELRPASGSLQALNGFVLNKSELIPTAEETWTGVKVVINAVLELNGL